MRLDRLRPDQFLEFCSRLLEVEGYQVVRAWEDFAALMVRNGTKVEVFCYPNQPTRSLTGPIPTRSSQLETLCLTNIREFPSPAGVRVWGLEELTEKAQANQALVVGLVPPAPLSLRYLEVKDFRGFESLRLNVSEGVTVLIGVNGSGKSSLLEALAIALSWLTRRVSHNLNAQGRRPSESDIRAEPNVAGCALHLACEFWGELVSWTVTASKKGRSPIGPSDLRALKPMVQDLQADLALGPEGASLPVVVYYPVNRAVLDIPRRIRKKHLFEPLQAYEDALVGGGNDFRVFFEWFREREDYENEVRARRDSSFRDPEIEAVRRAVSSLMPGYDRLRVQRRPQRILLTKGEQELEVEQLSDGEKCLLALTGDLARRLSLANPGHHDPLLGSGIVLIDEVELHLHPAWQRRVVPALRLTFPNCQFILTTHSPLVLSRVPKSSLRILRHFEILENTQPVEGRDSNSILAELMDVAVFPKETRLKLNRIENLIDQEQFDLARREVEQLAEKLGDHDPEVVHQRSAIEFLLAGWGAD